MTNFDERAKDWDSDPNKVDRAGVVADAIRKAVPLSSDMSALEYGCGTGLLSFFLQSDFASITLADTSQGMLEVLSEKIQAAGVANMHPVRLDLLSDPLPATRYHILYLLMTLHHIPNTYGILKKFAEVLLPGGYLSIADLDQEDGSFHTDGMANIHLGFARPALQQWVEAVGFINVHFSTVYLIRKRVKGSEKVYPVFLMIAQKAEYER